MKSKVLKYILPSIVLIFLCATALYSYKKNQSKRPYLTVMGYIDAADGLGRQSIELINALKDEVSIGFIPTENIIKLKSVPKDVCKIIKQKNKRIGKVVVFETCVWAPCGNFYEKLMTPAREDQIRIAYSMFESTKIPHEWTYILNTYFDAVAVPDKFLVNIYKNCGVNVPIFVLPLGLELDNFLSAPLKTKANTPFVFANLSTCIDRKNHLMLLQAFAKAFGDNPHVFLKINARYGDENLIQTMYEEIENLNLNNVQFTRLPLDKEAYLKMFLGVDCYVSLSKGEGFSIQPREAMALGIPVIATNNTGQSTICESLLVKVVDSKIEKPCFNAFNVWGHRYGNCFECTEEDAVKALLDVYQNYELYLKNANSSREWTKYYEYKNLKRFYKTLVKPSQIILGEENVLLADRLITDSKTLYEKYQKLTKEDK